MINSRKPKKVPSGRLSRLASFGGLASTLAGSALKGATKQLLSGQSPSFVEHLLTQDNAESITDRLAKMRGAAMKLGQLLSMDAGDLLPKEWEPILSRLRQQADPMPKSQLLAVLNDAWGKNWHDKFSYFSFEPIAAASIGQVHKATLLNGTHLAIKVQYPGVKESIDSDINNVASLIKLSGALPKHVDLEPLLTKAKAQLHEEADYEQEASYMMQYAELVSEHPIFEIPTVLTGLSNENVLGMTFLEGQAIESLSKQSDIDFCVGHLLDLTLTELFDFKLTQSDPNFANFMFNPITRTIQLFDFGATRHISDARSQHYLNLANAMQTKDTPALKQHLMVLGLIDAHMSLPTVDIIVEGCMLAAESLQSDGYNFKHKDLIKRLQAITMPLVQNKDATAAPDFEVALVNRKVTGIVLLANRLGATVDLKSLLAKHQR